MGWLHLVAAFVLLSHATVESGSIVKTLPGYPGKLPFKLETGYLSVGDLDDIQLFYYFIESTRNPVTDPLLLWLTGGPGCSGFSGLVYEIGPLKFDYLTFNGTLPSLLINKHAWTNVANIIFIDSPVGTGFSYSETQEGYHSSDTLTVEALYKFLNKWLLDHPDFIENPLYITGDSYSGIIIPQLTLAISNANIEGHKPYLNLQGYTVGNPVTDLHDDENSRIKYFFRVSLISEELYLSAVENCGNEFVTPDGTNSSCIDDIGLIAECTLKVNDGQILEPKCSFAAPKPKNSLKWNSNFLEDIPDEIIRSPVTPPENWCRMHDYVLSYVWANDPRVQLALHIRNGTITDWKRCNKTLDYDSNVSSSVSYHLELMSRGYRALAYSGDHDMMIPYVGTLGWISSLNMTVVDGWRPWFVHGQIAGFTEKYVLGIGDGMTFATIKGAGHTAPEYKPKQSLAMADRWFSYYSL